jgi:LPXTG-motif cell wall-anchored protein
LGVATVVALASAGVIASESTAQAAETTVSGQLQTVAAAGMADWTGWHVEAMVSGSSAPVSGADATADGRFTLPEPAAPTDGVAYILAFAPADPAHQDVTQATLAAVLTPGGTVVVNERTTVAMAWAMAQFVSNTGIDGVAPGLQNSAGMSQNVADSATGAEGAVLASSPNGSETSTAAAFNTLTAALASCVTAPLADTTAYPDGTCAAIVSAGAAADKATPVDTARALSSIARNPGIEPATLFGVSQQATLQGAPAVLSAAPDAWTLALRFDGNGQSLAGPGNFAIDYKGNVWVINNYQFNPDVNAPVCGSDKVFTFSPTGQMTPYSGGGLSGAGYGVEIDVHTGNVWIANFGFAAPAPGCPAAQQPPHNSASLFTADGRALSPAAGFTQGGLNWPQGLAIDGNNSVWTANCNSGTVTQFPGGDPDKAAVFPIFGQNDQPFDVVDNQRSLFVSAINGNAVSLLGYDGSVEKTLTGFEFDNPMGLAASPDGTVWVSNSGVITLPCPDRPTAADDQQFQSVLDARFDDTGTFTGPGADPFDQASVAAIAPDGSSVAQYTGGGITVPWGMATDGAGNAWIANFAGKRLSAFCGTDTSRCPTQAPATGDPISPATTGYFFDGLTRNTGVAIDQSGNVWLTNNWLEVPVQTNPGGHQIVAYLGLAAPTAVPEPDTPIAPVTPTTPAAETQALAATGHDTLPVLAIALLALATGAGIVFRRRRRGSRA